MRKKNKCVNISAILEARGDLYRITILSKALYDERLREIHNLQRSHYNINSIEYR